MKNIDKIIEALKEHRVTVTYEILENDPKFKYKLSWNGNSMRLTSDIDDDLKSYNGFDPIIEIAGMVCVELQIWVLKPGTFHFVRYDEVECV